MRRCFVTHKGTDYIRRASRELQQLGAFAVYVTELRELAQPILRTQDSVAGCMDECGTGQGSELKLPKLQGLQDMG